MRAIKSHFYILNIIWRSKKSIIFYDTINALVGRLKHLIYYILLFGQIFDLLQSDQSISRIMFWLSLAVVFSLVTQIYQDWYCSIYRPQAFIQLNTEMNRMLFEKAASVDIKYYETSEYYDKYTKSLQEADDRINNVITLTANIITGFIMICLYTYIIILRDYYAIVLTIIPLISVFVFGNKLNKAQYALFQNNVAPNREKDYVKRTVYLKDYAKEFRVSNIYNVLTDYFTASIQKITSNVRIYGKRIVVLQILNGFFGSTFMLLSAALYGAYLMMIPKSLDIGDFYILVSSIFNLLRILLNFANDIVQIQGNRPYIENFMSFLSCQNDTQKVEKELVPDKDQIDIQFNNVYFKYTDSDRYVLEDINLKIIHGQKIAIVGNNGSGKTTLVKLLLRLYDVCDGIIKYGDKDIKKINPDSYRDLFGVCFQDSQIFAMNVIENVLLADGEVNEELVIASLKASGIYNKISKSGGIYVDVTKEFNEEGVVLSGGEQQMLALSRVFAKDYPIVILDEPTSSLDPIAEENLFQNMLNLCQDKTVIFISHRLSSARIADKIFFMKDGTIVEEGNHEELIRQDGLYAEMFSSQAQEYQERN